MTKRLTTTEALKILYNYEDLQGGHDDYWKAYRFIEKQLKALQFFKNQLDIKFETIENRCFITLKFARFYARQELPKQEFDLLKEVLK